MNETLLTLPEMARKLRVSATTLRRWLKKGTIPSAQPGGPGSKHLFDEAVVREALKKMAVG